MSSSVYTRLHRILGPRALGTPAAVEPYARDESGLGSYPPEAVGLVESADEIREVLRLAQCDRIPVTPRGLGSGKTGGALAVEGGIVLSTERMRAIRSIDPEDLVAVVEPGAITGELQAAVDEQGLFYPPDPASLAYCSLGGNVAENAGGPRAFKYGVTRDYVLGMQLGLIGGELLDVGRRTAKGVTGLDLVGVITGSEGTLGVIGEIALRLLPKPPAVATFVACFSDALTAGRAVSALIAAGHRPRTLELLDTHVVEHLRAVGSWALPAGRQALLLIEVDGEPDAVDAELTRAAGACERAGALEVLVATDEARRRQLWEMRRSASGALKRRYPHKVSEDIVVPRSAIPSMLERLDKLAAERSVPIAAYGHAGDGNLHVNLLFDEPPAEGALEPLVAEVFRIALELGGTLSGEHGIGLAKRCYMELEQPQPLLELQRRLKRAFDPGGLLNPGKLLP